MKKKLLFFIAFFSVAKTEAQVKKGTLLTGGDMSFTTQSVVQSSLPDKQTASGFYFSPVLAKAIKDNLFFGGFLSFQRSKSTNAMNQKLKSNLYGTGIFLRSYKPVLKDLYAFIQPGLSVSWGKGDILLNSQSFQKSFQVRGDISTGLSFRISKKIYLETGFTNLATFDFLRTKTIDNTLTPAQITINKRFAFSSSLSAITANLSFGFRIMLPG
jgi:hypothetical protein